MSKKILLADDSLTIQKVIKLAFTSDDYEVTAVSDGAELLARARELRPHIILADIGLPGKNGYEVCSEVKADPDLKNTPVLLLSGTFEPIDNDRAIRAGADGHIVKPFESKELVTKVEALIERYSSLRETAEAPEKWEEDVIAAPEEEKVPGLEVFEGRGEVAPAGEEAGGPAPEMAVPEGETEGEAPFDVEGFDLEGFEVNPFREGEEAAGLPEAEKWSFEGGDVIGAPDQTQAEEAEETGPETPEVTAEAIAEEAPGSTAEERPAVEEAVPGPEEAPEVSAPEEAAPEAPAEEAEKAPALAEEAVEEIVKRVAERILPDMARETIIEELNRMREALSKSEE